MRHLFRRPSRENESQSIDEAPLDWTFEQGRAAFQRRPQFARILKLFFFFLKLFSLLVMICLLYLWWTNPYATNPKLQLQNPIETLIFPLHARFSFDTSVDNASQPHSPSFQLLGLQDLDQLETYCTRSFFAEMYVGGKIYFMLIDTGSEVSWIFCEPPFIISKDKLKLAGPHGYYEPSFENLILYKDLNPPGFYVCYESGFLCKDIYYVGGLVVNVLMVKETFKMQHIDVSTTSKSLVFGCGHSFKGPIDSIEGGVDGVLGLMPKFFSLPYQLASIRAINKIFGLCLKSHIHHRLKDVVGYLFFGDEVSSVQEQMTWIKMISDATPFGFAAAFLKSIQTGRFNHQVGKQNAKMVFDTGTTMTYLMPDIYDALIQYLEEHAIQNGYKPLSEDIVKGLLKNGDKVQRLLENHRTCWYRDLINMNSIWCKNFENFVFAFDNTDGNEGAQYQIEPLQYLSAFKIPDIDLKIGIICSWFNKHETKSSSSLNIFGGLAFQGHLVVFDIDNKKIGWSTPKDCELLKLEKRFKNRIHYMRFIDFQFVNFKFLFGCKYINMYWMKYH